MATSPWLTVGREYDVLEILADPGQRVLLRVETDESGSPGLWGAGLFRTVSAQIPPSWSADIQDDGSVMLGAEGWRRPGFWERYYDGDPSAVGVGTTMRWRNSGWADKGRAAASAFAAAALAALLVLLVSGLFAITVLAPAGAATQGQGSTTAHRRDVSALVV
jgi:hypothetical protein